MQMQIPADQSQSGFGDFYYSFKVFHWGGMERIFILGSM
jgi:hypothetical protein